MGYIYTLFYVIMHETHTTTHYRNKVEVGTMYHLAEFVDLRWCNTVHDCSVTDLISYPITCV